MIKPPVTDQMTVRDAKSGQFITVHGAGALKGRLTIAKGFDLTKPIASQAMGKTGKGGGAPAKR